MVTDVYFDIVSNTLAFFAIIISVITAIYTYNQNKYEYKAFNRAKQDIITLFSVIDSIYKKLVMVNKDTKRVFSDNDMEYSFVEEKKIINQFLISDTCQYIKLVLDVSNYRRFYYSLIDIAGYCSRSPAEQLLSAHLCVEECDTVKGQIRDISDKKWNIFRKSMRDARDCLNKMSSDENSTFGYEIEDIFKTDVINIYNKIKNEEYENDPNVALFIAYNTLQGEEKDNEMTSAMSSGGKFYNSKFLVRIYMLKYIQEKLKEKEQYDKIIDSVLSQYKNGEEIEIDISDLISKYSDYCKEYLSILSQSTKIQEVLGEK